jgi:hypothetical protein
MNKLMNNTTKADLSNIFSNCKTLKKDQFVLNCFNNKTILEFFGRLEKKLMKFTNHLEKKLKNVKHKFPLDRTSKIEQRDVPITISTLCEKINNLLSKKEFEIEKELHILSTKEKEYCESVVNAIIAGFIEEIDFSEVPFIIL